MSDSTDSAKPVRVADLTGEVCPMTFVRAKLHLAEIEPGDLIEIILKEGEQMRNVPRSLKSEGHRVESVRQDGQRYHLFVRKGAGGN